MVNEQGSGQQAIYQIRVQGLIGPQWSAWFDGMAIVSLADGETLLVGPVADQAALHGILAKVRDMHLPLISVVLDPSGE
jgi:hypothetical protein